MSSSYKIYRFKRFRLLCLIIVNFLVQFLVNFLSEIFYVWECVAAISPRKRVWLRSPGLIFLAVYAEGHSLGEAANKVIFFSGPTTKALTPFTPLELSAHFRIYFSSSQIFVLFLSGHYPLSGPTTRKNIFFCGFSMSF